IGAYSEEGMVWTDEMCSVIERNLEYACSFIKENFPGVSVMKPQGTYMLYLDCSEWCREHNETVQALQYRGVKAGVIWQDGETFVMKNTIRMNLALPTHVLKEAMDRLKEKAFI
ncbi:MAG: aspartate aminotransferase, partial [Oscillospiraceae bacterium]|nr:aspartate aminotransferase [Oscillospiraceae bacterium]